MLKASWISLITACNGADTSKRDRGGFVLGRPLLCDLHVSPEAATSPGNHKMAVAHSRTLRDTRKASLETSVCVFYLTARPGIILQRERTFSNAAHIISVKQKRGIILPQFHKHNTAYCLCKIQVNISDFPYGGFVHSSAVTSQIRPR